MSLLWIVSWLLILSHASLVSASEGRLLQQEQQQQQQQQQKKIDGVILTTGKDTRAFEHSIVSSLRHLVDVDKFYVITPDFESLQSRLAQQLGPRVIFIDEKIFPFDWRNVSDIMIRTVEQRGVYPLNGKSQFEHTVWGRVGWFLQQLLKLYSGRVLNLGDFVLLDSDIVWFRDIKFINTTMDDQLTRYYYACSSQYHPAYVATLKRVSGVDLYHNSDMHRSGIVHHIVIVKAVLEDLMQQTEQRYGIDFWKVLLNESAVELTCRAPRGGICGGGSTLSEYELYFNYARVKYPQTVQLRPLMWANGPMPGLLFWPPEQQQSSDSSSKDSSDSSSSMLYSDGPKSHWMGHRQVEVPSVLVRQMQADKLQGFDYVAYHGYGRRRYFELIDPDIDAMCKGMPIPQNSTCSWRGFDERRDKSRTAESWFQHCACYMANHQSGP